LSGDGDARLRVLLTGAAGRIGEAFRAYVGDRYALRLAAHHPEKIADPGAHELIRLELADLDACRAACRDIDVVVHMGAIASPRVGFYEGLLDANIKGVYNILRAAKDQGCRRVVVASSVQAVAGYPLDVQVRTDDAPRPVNMYGVCKAFAEAACHHFAKVEGLSCIAVRIGSFEDDWVAKDPNARNLTTFISKRDMSELLVRCVEVDDVDFAVVHGVSDNRYKFLDMRDTREVLGFTPVDDAFRFFEMGLRYTDRWYDRTPQDETVRARPTETADKPPQS
jgi:NAD+ dependent glucose-6-phosphate dehydrogenase